MIRMTCVILAFVFLLPLAASAYEPYVGVHPENATATNLGAGGVICPGHPTQWVAAIVYMGKRRNATTDLSHSVKICVYCKIPDLNDPTCKPRWFNAVELAGFIPDRTWSLPGVGGFCPPGNSADSSHKIVNNSPLTTQDLGSGCNSGPDIEP